MHFGNGTCRKERFASIKHPVLRGTGNVKAIMISHCTRHMHDKSSRGVLFFSVTAAFAFSLPSSAPLSSRDGEREETQKRVTGWG